MRRLAVAAVLFVATSAGAQQEKPTSIFAFVRNPAYAFSRNSGSTSWGLALQHRVTPRLSLELMAARSNGITRDSSIFGGPEVVTEWTVTPIDVAASYHIVNEISWKPYVGGAVRWTRLPAEAGDEDSVMAGPVAGVVWPFRPSVGLRIDGRLMLGTNSRYADIFNASAGVVWRF